MAPAVSNRHAGGLNEAIKPCAVLPAPRPRQLGAGLAALKTASRRLAAVAFDQS
jgi:hypothetical protein